MSNYTPTARHSHEPATQALPPKTKPKTRRWARPLAVAALVATLAATGGVVTAQPGGAPSTSDFKPRCCP